MRSVAGGKGNEGVRMMMLLLFLCLLPLLDTFVSIINWVRRAPCSEQQCTACVPSFYFPPYNKACFSSSSKLYFILTGTAVQSTAMVSSTKLVALIFAWYFVSRPSRHEFPGQQERHSSCSVALALQLFHRQWHYDSQSVYFTVSISFSFNSFFSPSAAPPPATHFRVYYSSSQSLHSYVDYGKQHGQQGYTIHHHHHHHHHRSREWFFDSRQHASKRAQPQAGRPQGHPRSL
ncbi:MAG: hypothetical protein J3R72DRAFT_214272 [Linnemannia gamsii]|nr:MAG: hypothetical protein J3R72DRAFT_214272 [Linnemannia gamsii]